MFNLISVYVELIQFVLPSFSVDIAHADGFKNFAENNSSNVPSAFSSRFINDYAFVPCIR